MRFTAALALLAIATSVHAAAPPTASVEGAVARALKRVEAGLVNYPKQRSCFGCHHHAVGVFSLTAARGRGFPVDADFVEKQIAFSLKTFSNHARIRKGEGIGGEITSAVYMLETLAIARHPHDETTAALIEYVLLKQRKDGAWPMPGFAEKRPPTMGSSFTNSGLAISALKASAPPKDAKGAAEVQKRIDDAIVKGRDWLLANKPVSNEDRVFHLWGLAASGAEAKHIEAAREGLLKQQKPDGSWAQLEKMSADAYATATALVALRKGGLSADCPAYRHGIRYLIRTQRPDGAWVVTTRATALQKFFDNGDVGGKSQFISFAATNWAVVALTETLPSRDRKKTRVEE